MKPIHYRMIVGLLVLSSVTLAFYVYYVNLVDYVARLGGTQNKSTPTSVENAKSGSERRLHYFSSDSLVSVDDPPMPADDQFSTDANTPPTKFAASGGLDNDNDTADIHSGDSFTYIANDGEVDSNLATVAITVDSAHATFTDSFEGGGTTGWDDEWSVSNQSGFAAGLATTNEVTPPAGGGTHTLRQHWDGSHIWNGMTEWLQYGFDSGVDEGEVIEFEYYLMYHANFSNNGTYVKNVVMRAGTANEFYLDSHDPGGAMFVLFQQVTVGAAADELYSNINGGQYRVPNGQWVHFKWQIKVSTQENGDPRNGYLYGWVNGTKRWEYDNINTIHSGKYTELNLNSTFNNPVLEGPNQKRYWDLFSIRAIAR